MTEMKNNIILIGGGGHCKVVIDVIEKIEKYQIRGIIDVREKLGTNLMGYKVIGTDNDLIELVNRFKYFFITIGQIGISWQRVKIYENLKKLGASLPVIVSPFSVVSKTAEIGEGSVVMHQVIINPDSVIGNNCIINSKALIEHDVHIGSQSHISTNVTINGGCNIGDNCFVGSGTTLFQGVKIVDEVVIGAGSLVTKDLTSKGIYYGSPVKKIK